MKNLKYFPFERNRYYYGKLLSEQDFVDEQRYLNDKRRLLNRVMFGAGVAAGLEVVAVDEKSVSVEAGLALDFSGREILVDVPVIRRLSTIDGFDALVEQEKRRYLYLCIEYGEKEIIPAHNVMGGQTSGGEAQDYEKYREGYRLYLTAQEPETPVLTRQDLVLQSQTLYQDGRLRISQTLPRFAAGGAAFETALVVENLGESLRFSGRLSETLGCAEAAGRQTLVFEFEETLLEKGAKLEKRASLKAAPVSHGKAQLKLEPENFALKAERRALELAQERTLSVELDAGGAEASVDRLYYRNLMEDVIRDDYPQGIYLARIQLVHHERTYLIDGVEDMLPGQRLPSAALLRGQLELLRGACEASAAQPVRRGEERQEARPAAAGTAKSGRVEIALGIGAKRGQRFFSHEIFHGLGLGPVQVQLALEEDEFLSCGSPEVFEEAQVRAELAARVNMEKGSFVIGLRMLEPTAQQHAVIHWRAEAAEQRAESGSQSRRLFVRPERLEMRVRENAWLEAVCPGVPGISVLWSVRTPEGGSITQDGMYTSPNLPGVYEIAAASQEFPELRTSIFAIVRE